MNENIKGKVIVISGASSGLGEAAARHLSERGATVILGARRTDRIESLAKELKAKGGQPWRSPPTSPTATRCRSSSTRRLKRSDASTS